MARPREFDPDDALDKAMHQFWAKGYYDTSIRDLIERTGVNYYGLYGTFKNKRGLFLASLDRYRELVTSEIVGALKKPGPVHRVIAKAFDRLLDLTQTPDGRVGCLMCNTAVEVAPHDADVAAKVKAHSDLLTKAFRARLVEARDAGELSADKDVKALAEFLATTAYSAGLLSRAGFDRKRVKQHIKTALSTLV